MTLNIYYYMYECLKLVSFPRLSQLAKFSCNKSCGGVPGIESKRAQQDDNFFCFFVLFLFYFFFAGSDPGGPSSEGRGAWTGRWRRSTLDSPEEVSYV